MAEQSFLGELLRKQAAMIRIGEQTGKNVNAALSEVARQRNEIKNPITGEGVTKSRIES